MITPDDVAFDKMKTAIDLVDMLLANSVKLADELKQRITDLESQLAAAKQEIAAGIEIRNQLLAENEEKNVFMLKAEIALLKIDVEKRDRAIAAATEHPHCKDGKSCVGSDAYYADKAFSMGAVCGHRCAATCCRSYEHANPMDSVKGGDEMDPWIGGRR